MKKTNVAYVMGLAGMMVTASVWAEEPPAGAPVADALSPNEIAAQALYEKGKEALLGDKLAEAQAIFEQSWALARLPKTAAQLGNVLIQREKLVEGANYLEWFFQEGKDAPDGVKKGVRRTLNSATPHIAALKLVVEPADAAVRIDNEPIASNQVGWTHYVAPGKEHTFQAEKKGFEAVTVKKSFGAGMEETVTLTLVPAKEEAKVPVKVEGPKVVQPQGMPMRVKVAWVAGSLLGGVAIGTGIGAGFRYRITNEALKRTPCGDCIRDVGANAPTLERLTGIAIVTGVLGGGALGLAGYLTWSDRRERVQVRLVPFVNGIELMGTF